MDAPLSLPALLSQPLIAFTIEFDNEFEHRTPHRTSNHASTPGAPWLVSMVMWTRFLRFVPGHGIPIAEFHHLAGGTKKNLQIWLTRLSKWWGYIAVEQNLVIPTPGGRKAIAVWQPLTGLIESRWRQRYGSQKIERLMQALLALTIQMDADLPGHLPILGYGLFSAPDRPGIAVPDATLPALLSKALLAFAVEFEQRSPLSLAICANLLRLARPEGARIRDLPRLSGVSKEAISMALGVLQKQGYASVQPDTQNSRVRLFTLTFKGGKARDAYVQIVTEIEDRWRAHFGSEVIRNVREALESLADPATSFPAMFRAPEPYPDGWRASFPQPETLPHFPMILHRGGFPDGA